jgi:hypothetical protein
MELFTDLTSKKRMNHNTKVPLSRIDVGSHYNTTIPPNNAYDIYRSNRKNDYVIPPSIEQGQAKVSGRGRNRVEKFTIISDRGSS